MIYALNLGYETRKFRIWLDELPEAFTYKPFNTYEQTLTTTKALYPIKHTATVELFLNVGPYAKYGILGASFTATPSHEIIVQVITSEDNQPIIDCSLAWGSEEVHVGIPNWAGKTILTAAIEMVEIGLIGSGTLCFCYGANGIVGSSIWVFSKLAKILVKIFASFEKITEEALISTIRSVIY